MSTETSFDVVIVGAGPGGLSAALNAHKNNLNYLLLEKADHLADTIYCYQKGKPVMAEPTVIPKRGELWMEAALREEILNHWGEAAEKVQLRIAFNEGVAEVQKQNGSFQIKTPKRLITAKKVILATGTQGNPRKLGVSGEDFPHVLPRLEDPEMFSDQDIVVVGGGDAGIEIAIALCSRNRVTLCVRTSEFVRVKGSLERQVLDKQKKGELTIHFSSSVEKVDPDSVTLKLSQTSIQVKAQVVIVKIGTLPLRGFLEKCGVGFPTPEPGAPPVLSGSYESSVAGLHLIGALSGRGSDLIKSAINQGYEVIEHIVGHHVEPADEELLKTKVPFLTGTVAERIKAFQPKIPLLSAASEDQIREMLLFSEFHDFKPGQIIFRQHDFSDSLYMILEGTVDISIKSSRTDEEKIVASKGPGDFFGEMSLISDQQRSATVKAATQARVLEASRKAMLKLLHTTPAAKDIVDKTFLANALQTYLFPTANLERACLTRLADHARVQTIEKGKAIIKEGDPGDAFYFLRSGKVKISKNHEGQEIILTYLSAGQYFGEMALMSDHPRMATVTAIDKVEIVQLLKEDFEFLKAQPRIQEIIGQETNKRRLDNIDLGTDPMKAASAQFLVREEIVVGENVLLIDENRCIHCDNCVKACEGVHPDGQTRLKRTGQKFANILIANSCRHCENALCLTDCPPGDAITRDPHGEVFIDPKKCIACGNCATNCPYDNIFMVHPEHTEAKESLFDWVKQAVGFPKSPKSEPQKKALAVKCDLCRELDGGPACVRSCPTGAVLRLKPEEYYKKIRSLTEERENELAI